LKFKLSAEQAQPLQSLPVFGDSGEVINFSSDSKHWSTSHPIAMAHEAYKMHIINYTKRRLTYASDSLNAISAILESLKHASPGLDFCYGLPITSVISIKGQLFVTHIPFAHSLTCTHGPNEDLSEWHRPHRGWGHAFRSWTRIGWYGSGG
jgi:hypothetical protein